MDEPISLRLERLGIELPAAAPAAANYVPAVVSGGQVFIAGQVPFRDGRFEYVGSVGADLGIDEGIAAARLCGLNILAQLKAALGDLDRVRRCVKLNVFVRSAADFTLQPRVANGASDLMVQIFGDRGKHARSAVGVSQLPFGVAVEVDATYEFA